MKFVVISDTHGHHRDLELPQGEAIIHCGDFCDYGKESDMYDFLNWYQALDFKFKILIAGNHDFFATKKPEKFQEILPQNITYLNDSGTDIQGIKLWGSPVQPDLINWAFGKKRGEEMKVHWDLIPNKIDILITHTPPYDILDKNRSNKSLGCEELIKVVKQIKPKVHLFGHIHASYGKKYEDDTLFINASNYNSEKGLVNPPIIFELST